MAGFGPVIHDCVHLAVETWMPATSAGMTENPYAGRLLLLSRAVSATSTSPRASIATP
jgi:hypothetical protein